MVLFYDIDDYNENYFPEFDEYDVEDEIEEPDLEWEDKVAKADERLRQENSGLTDDWKD